MTDESDIDELKALLALGVLAIIFGYVQLRTARDFLFSETDWIGAAWILSKMIDLSLVIFSTYIVGLITIYATKNQSWRGQGRSFENLSSWLRRNNERLFRFGTIVIVIAVFFGLIRIIEIGVYLLIHHRLWGI